MFNILKANETIPDSIKSYKIYESSLISSISECRRKYADIGWNIWKEGNSLYFLNINPDNIENEPEIIDKIIDDSSMFEEIEFKWNQNKFNQNVFSFALSASFTYQVKKKYGNQISFPSELGLRNRNRNREFLLSDPHKFIQSQPVYMGISLRPIILNFESSNLSGFIVNRIIRTTSSLIGAPRELQNITSINTTQYLKDITKFLGDLHDAFHSLCIGDFQFSIVNNLIDFNMNQVIDLQDNEGKSYPVDDEEVVFAEENEINELEEELEIEYNSIPLEILDESLPIIPIELMAFQLEEAALTVGSGFSRKSTTTMFMLNKYGPFKVKENISLVLIPIYLSSQPEIKTELENLCKDLKDGVSVGGFRFPGLAQGFNTTVYSKSPFSISLQQLALGLDVRIREIFQTVRREIPLLDDNFKVESKTIPIFIFGQKYEEETKKGEFSPYYRMIKAALTNNGIPNQTIVRFYQLNKNKWRIFPLWSLASQIFSKIGGVPWVLNSRLDKRGNPIHAIVGLRFAKRYNSSTGKKYILGIVSIITGNGQFMGCLTDTYNFSMNIEKYNWICRQHGLNRFYDGLKLSKDDVNSLCRNLITFLQDRLGLEHQTGSIVIHRLGLVPEEEKLEFIRCFNESNFSMALISISNFDLKYLSTSGNIKRGLCLQLDNDNAYLFTQGEINFHTSIYNTKQFKPRSCPSALKIKRIADTGVYDDVIDASKDIFSLTRMNWRHTTYTPSNYPISLQYALLVAQNMKNGIYPSGDYKNVPWFL